MKKFKFNLEGLLKIKKIEEKKRMLDFSNALSEYSKVIIEIKNYFNESKRLLEKTKSENYSFNITHMRDFQAYFSALEKKKKSCRKESRSFTD